jgi:hypothetical protein
MAHRTRAAQDQQLAAEKPSPEVFAKSSEELSRVHEVRPGVPDAPRSMPGHPAEQGRGQKWPRRPR